MAETFESIRVDNFTSTIFITCVKRCFEDAVFTCGLPEIKNKNKSQLVIANMVANEACSKILIFL